MVGHTPPAAPAPAPRAPEPQYLAIFMPWAAIGNELKIGPVTIWDYQRHADETIKDTKVREQLDKVLACYVGKDGKPAHSVAMLTHSAADFRLLNDAEQEAIQRAADALAFSAIYSNASDLIRFNTWTDAPPSSDRYQFYLQKFTLGARFVTVRAGVSADTWPIEDLRISQPWALGGTRSCPDYDLIEAFGCVLDPAFPEDDRRRIFRSLEWFRMAHTQVDQVHPLMKVVMMATAFEILLAVGHENGKARYIREKVDEKFKHTDSLTETLPGQSPPMKGHPQVDIPITLTKAAWWAQDFYSMRNDITHGNYIDPARLVFTLPNGRHMSQLEVAAVVFGELIVWELEERKCCGDKVDDFMSHIRTMDDNDTFGPLERKKMWTDGVRFVHNLDDVHRVLGWVAPRPGSKIEPDDDDDF